MTRGIWVAADDGGLEWGYDGLGEEHCSDCDDTGRCWACDGDNPQDDLGSGCSECDGWGHCWCGAGT